MSREAKQLSTLLDRLRKSIADLDRLQAKSKLSDCEVGILDERRTNLSLTIAALEDRLSAVRGLIDLGRPHIIRVH